MTQATLSRKYQIVIPKEAREKMGLRAGDKILVDTLPGVTILLPKPDKLSRHLRGISKGYYPKNYLHRERKTWPR